MIPVVTSVAGMDRLRDALARPLVSLAQQELALWAFQLRLRDQFDELLCLSRLTHIRRLDYQVETVLKVLRTFRGRALLADEVGLGKTIEAGMLIAEFVLRGMARRTLVIVPAALVGQWQSELREKFAIQARSSDEALFRSEPERAWAEASGVVVASLQLARSARHAPLVRAQKWDLVVVDEAHHVKNRETAGYQLVDALKSRYLLLLTATPVENSLDELYNLVTLLKPGQLATPAAFRREFLAKGDPFSPKNRDKQVDMILGRSMQEQEFEDRIFDILARAQSDADVQSGFDALAEELAKARTDYDKVQALDEALFRRDFET